MIDQTTTGSTRLRDSLLAALPADSRERGRVIRRIAVRRCCVFKFRYGADIYLDTAQRLADGLGLRPDRLRERLCARLLGDPRTISKIANETGLSKHALYDLVNEQRVNGRPVDMMLSTAEKLVAALGIEPWGPEDPKDEKYADRSTGGKRETKS